VLSAFHPYVCPLRLPNARPASGRYPAGTGAEPGWKLILTAVAAGEYKRVDGTTAFGVDALLQSNLAVASPAFS
jgi:hypothetical protein